MNRGSHRGGDDSSTIALLFGNGWPPMKVRDLTTVGHANGILGFRMNGMLVERTTGRDHEEYGIAFRGSRVGTAWGNRPTRSCIGALILDTGPNGPPPLR